MKLNKETLLQNFSEARHIENILNQDELEFIWKLAFQDGDVRKNSLGNLFIIGDCVKDSYNMIKHKLPIDTEFSGGNFFITNNPYGLHMDGFKENQDNIENYIVYKNILIPLWIGGSNEGGNLVFFNQRLIDYSSAFNKGGKSEYNQSTYKIHIDYSDLQYYDQNGHEINKSLNNEPLDVEIYNNHLSHIEYARLDGFTVENIFPWVPGDIMIFDALQVHASTWGTPKWLNKMGLLLKFKVKM